MQINKCFEKIYNFGNFIIKMTNYGINKINSQPANVNPDYIQSKNPINLPLVIMGVFAVIIISLGTFLFFQGDEEKEIPQIEEQIEESVKESVISEDCNDFADKLESCEPFSCEFEHPLAESFGIEDTIMKRNIVGLTEDGKCNYIEELPNDGEMECNYSDETKIVAVKSFRGLELSEEEYNILQNAWNGEECVISGYD